MVRNVSRFEEFRVCTKRGMPGVKKVIILLMLAATMFLLAFLIANPDLGRTGDDTNIEASENANPSDEGTTSDDPSEPSVPSDPTSDQPNWHYEAAFSRFLTDVNYHGVINGHDKPVPPGTKPPVDGIPKADQSMVGQTVPIVFAAEQDVVPFYYTCSEDGVERLAVVVNSANIPLLIVFEPNLGGAGGLCDKIVTQEVFEAKILSMTNISYDEGNMYANNACRSDYDLAEDEIVDISSSKDTLQTGEYLGVVGKDEAGEYYSFLKGGKRGELSDGMCRDIDVFASILERFSLPDISTLQPSVDTDNKAELAKLERLFQLGEANWYHYALASYYTTPTEVNLAYFFYNGFDECSAARPTPDEEALLKDMPGFDPEFDLIRLPADRMDAVLQQYFGAGLSQFDVSDLWYVESTNTYYLSHTDAVGFIELVFERMETAGDGTITIYYMADSMPGILKLKASGDGYRILSNQPA